MSDQICSFSNLALSAFSIDPGCCKSDISASVDMHPGGLANEEKLCLPLVEMFIFLDNLSVSSEIYFV